MSGERSLLALLGEEAAHIVAPMLDAVADPDALARFVWRARWSLPDVSSFDRPTLEAAVTDVQTALETVSEGQLAADTLADVVDALSAVRSVFTAVDAIPDVATELLGDPPGDVAVQFGADLAELMLLTWLEDRAPQLHDVLELLTIIGPEIPTQIAVDGVILRSALTRTGLHLDRLGTLLTDPVTELASAYLPSGGLDSQADAAALVATLFRRLVAPLARLDGQVLAGLEYEVPAEHGDPAFNPVRRSGTVRLPLPPIASVVGPEVGVTLEVVPPQTTSAGGNAGPGVEISTSGLTGWEISSGAWRLVVSTDSGDGSGGSGTTTFVSSDGVSTIGDELILTVELVRGDEDAPALVIGGDTGSRLVLGRLLLTGFTAIGAGEPDFGASVGAESASLVFSAGDGDGFIGSVLPTVAWTLDLDLSLSWSRRSGWTIGGSPGLTIRQPIPGSVVGIGLDDLILSLVAADGGLSSTAGFTVTIDIGPFEADIEGVGLALALIPATPPPGNLGPFDLSVRFAPPSRVTFSIEAEAVRGGGFLSVDGDRYVGGLSLDVLAVGVDAFTIIDTTIPGTPGGFALFATLTLRFPGIPLGFGFSLTGLGGIIALNRAIDAEALALGLRDGAADAVLFPDNALRDADLLVTQIDEYFPIQAGTTVFGPVAEISWGVPIMITGQLGVVISLPDGVIVVLGSIEATLPDPNAPILELHLDTLGALDIAGGTLLVVASLYDSRLLGLIELSGDAAVYVSWLENPYFLLSVGGFHPGFQPPAHVPAVLETLREMRAEVDIGLGVTAGVEAYFAVTSNTVQFGGGVDIEASADFLLTTYTARGWFEFDVLIKFSPFVIVADASAGVGVYAGDKELLGVALALHLEGPDPWYASGTARFKFFGINVKFDFAVGGHAPPALPPSENVLTLVRQALAEPAAWAAVPQPGPAAGITFGSEDADGWVRPDSRLVVRQTVAPFDHLLARFGETAPQQDEVFVTGVALVDSNGAPLDGLDVADELDWFAPALYDVLPDHARLAAPSYEQMKAGAGIGAPGVGLPDGDRVAMPDGHETQVWDPASGKGSHFDRVSAPRRTADLVAASAAGRAAAGRRVAVAVDQVAVAPTSYRTIDPVTGAAGSPPSGFAQAVAAAAAGGRVVPVIVGGQP